MGKLEYINFGEKLRTLRILRDMTTSELAQAIDRSPDYIDKLENHSSWKKLDVNFNDIVGLSDALKVRPEYFFNDIPLNQELKLAKMLENPDFKELMSLLNSLPNEDQVYFKSLIAKLGSNN